MNNRSIFDIGGQNEVAHSKIQNSMNDDVICDTFWQHIDRVVAVDIHTDTNEKTRCDNSGQSID